MSDDDSPRALFANLGALIVSEVLGYAAFLLNLPFAFSSLFMLVMIIAVLSQFYGLDIAAVIRLFPIPTSGHFEYHGGSEGCFRAYAVISFWCYLGWEIIRSIFRLKQATLKRQLLGGAIMATAGWGFVLIHAPFMKMAPGSSRVAGFFIDLFLYVLGLAGFLLGTLISRFSDQLIARIVAPPTAVR